jgi:hypothetical protein
MKAAIASKRLAKGKEIDIGKPSWMALYGNRQTHIEDTYETFIVSD